MQFAKPNTHYYSPHLWVKDDKDESGYSYTNPQLYFRKRKDAKKYVKENGTITEPKNGTLGFTVEVGLKEGTKVYGSYQEWINRI